MQRQTRLCSLSHRQAAIIRIQAPQQTACVTILLFYCCCFFCFFGGFYPPSSPVSTSSRGVMRVHYSEGAGFHFFARQKQKWNVLIIKGWRKEWLRGGCQRLLTNVFFFFCLLPIMIVFLLFYTQVSLENFCVNLLSEK